MDEVLRMIEIIEDIRQPWKVKHKLLDIVVIVLFSKTIYWAGKRSAVS